MKGQIFIECRAGHNCSIARISNTPFVNCDPAKLTRPPRPPGPLFPPKRRGTGWLRLSLAFLRTDWHWDGTRALPVSSWCQAGYSLCVCCITDQRSSLAKQHSSKLGNEYCSHANELFPEAAVWIIVLFEFLSILESAMKIFFSQIN